MSSPVDLSDAAVPAAAPSRSAHAAGRPPAPRPKSATRVARAALAACARADGGDAALVRAGRAVLRQQAHALARVGRRLTPAFARAARTLADCRGQVAVVGVGKSGHVGRKLAATLASLGTPASFVHATEALHGDLGRVRSDDVALVLSNSGESAEVVALLPALRRRCAALVALTASCTSRLGKAADVVVAVGIVREASPDGLAPTTSAGAALALGDALALVAASLRGQSAADYGALHPGGALGRRFRPVREVMRTGARNPRVPQTATVACALAAMTDASGGPGGPGAACIVDGAGRLMGLLTDGDVRRLLLRGALDCARPVREVVRAMPHCVDEGASLAQAAAKLRAHAVDQLPVVDAAGRPVGLIDVQDVLAAG